VIPTFSVVLAAYNRGRHIVPTIRSVLDQSFQDFELIVVGDCCTDETGRVVGTLDPARVRWVNLPQRSGSQAGPNNAGIELARGRYVAYIGHDDIWSRDHLATLYQCFSRHPDSHFAIAGCIYYGPPGSGYYIVTGMFEAEDDGAPGRHFFPPSSLAHRRDIAAVIGPWRKAEEERAPVDAEFLLRAFNAGLRFAPTGRVTVHKFAAGHRYLSYLQIDSSEQAQLLHMMTQPGFSAFVSDVVHRSRQTQRFMIATHADYARYAPGQLASSNRKSKGILRPPLQALTTGVRMTQADEPAALDWHTLQTERAQPLRWSGPNPRPRLLLPFTTVRKVDLCFDVLSATEGNFEPLRLRVNGWPVASEIVPHDAIPGASIVRCRTRLRRADYSIVELDLTGGMPLDALMRQIDGTSRQIALGTVSLAPLSWLTTVWPSRPLPSMAAASSTYGG
jgi:Glycosyl transferase family 2